MASLLLVPSPDYHTVVYVSSSCNLSKQTNKRSRSSLELCWRINYRRAAQQLLMFNHAGTREGDCGCRHLFHSVVFLLQFRLSHYSQRPFVPKQVKRTAADIASLSLSQPHLQLSGPTPEVCRLYCPLRDERLFLFRINISDQF